MLIWWRGPDAAADLTGVPHGILRREQLEALRDHTALLQAARAQADALLAQAREEAAALRAQAQQDADALWAQAQTRIEQACEAGRAEESARQRWPGMSGRPGIWSSRPMPSAACMKNWPRSSPAPLSASCTAATGQRCSSGRCAACSRCRVPRRH